MKTNLYIIILLIVPNIVFSQFYDFVSFNRIYFESDNWTSVSNGEVWDDPGYEISLPFEFEIYGEKIQTIYIMEDGYGTQLGTKPTFDEGPVSLILPLDLDVIDRGYNQEESISDIRYTTQTTNDNELFIIEWHNVGFYNEISDGGVGESFISFQVIFNKNFNAIELSFGESNIANPELIYEGETGASICLIQNVDDDPTTPIAEAVCLTGEADNPSTMLFDISESEPSYLIGDIPENKAYLFSVNDAVPTYSNNLDPKFSIYPTTAIDRIYVESQFSIESYSLISVKGELLCQANWNDDYIDISNLSSGQYFITLNYETNKSKTTTFFKL